MQSQTQQIIEDLQSLSALISGFLLERKARGLQPRSIEFYRRHLKHFTVWLNLQGIIKLDQIKPSVIREFLLYLEDTKHNPGGVHGFFRSLRAFFKWLEFEDLILEQSNPIRKVKSPKIPTEPLDPIPLDDIRALLKTCKSGFIGERDKSIILTLFDSGVRANELLKIDKTDCNLITGDILIRRGKGAKPRTVFIGRTARRVVRAYIKTRSDSSPSLFVTDEGERITYDGLRAIMTRRAKLAGIKPTPIHGFRRSFTINMLRAGVDPISISRLLGHNDLQMILKYIKQTSEDLREKHSHGSPADSL